MTEPLDLFAPFYDLEYGDFRDDIAMYQQFAEWSAPDGQDSARALEVGCGSGRLLLALAQMEHQCVGLDASRAMLDLAQSKADEQGLELELVQGQMQDRQALQGAGEFNLIICALNSFSYLTEREDQIAALENMRDALAPGGIIALDLTPPGNAAPFPADGELVLQGRWPFECGEVVKLVSGTWDAASQIHYVNWIYDRSDAEGLVRRTIIEQSLRYVYPAEAELLIERAGLEVDGIYGSYAMDSFDSGSERMIVIAKRA